MRDLIANENDVLRARVAELEAEVDRLELDVIGLEVDNDELRELLVKRVVLGLPVPCKSDAPPSRKFDTSAILNVLVVLASFVMGYLTRFL